MKTISLCILLSAFLVIGTGSARDYADESCTENVYCFCGKNITDLIQSREKENRSEPHFCDECATKFSSAHAAENNDYTQKQEQTTSFITKLLHGGFKK